jgi:hypothetical protein
VHHKIAPFPTRSVDLLFSIDNLEVICTPCHAKEHHDSKLSFECKRCGMVFRDNATSKRAYCSVECDMAARRARRRLPRKCLVCKAEFQPRGANIVTCSHPCGMKLSSQKKQAKRPTFTCPVCQKVFSMPRCQAARGIVDPCCSRSCAIRKRTPDRREAYARLRVHLTCPKCQKAFDVPQSRVTDDIPNPCCSAACSYAYRREQTQKRKMSGGEHLDAA